MLMDATRLGVPVLILDIKTTDADPATEILVIYCTCPGGVIQVDNNPSNFIIRE